MEPWREWDQQSDEATVSLSWRLPAADSLADWTIAVRVKDDVTMYHVHRALLAVPPRRSTYFQLLFRQTEFTEATSRTTELELEPSAAEA